MPPSRTCPWPAPADSRGKPELDSHPFSGESASCRAKWSSLDFENPGECFSSDWSCVRRLPRLKRGTRFCICGRNAPASPSCSSYQALATVSPNASPCCHGLRITGSMMGCVRRRAVNHTSNEIKSSSLQSFLGTRRSMCSDDGGQMRGRAETRRSAIGL